MIAVQTLDPFKVLVAAILSARIRDGTTAKASRRLFNDKPDIHALAGLSEERIPFSPFITVYFYKRTYLFLAYFLINTYLFVAIFFMMLY